MYINGIQLGTVGMLHTAIHAMLLFAITGGGQCSLHDAAESNADRGLK